MPEVIEYETLDEMCLEMIRVIVASDPVPAVVAWRITEPEPTECSASRMGFMNQEKEKLSECEAVAAWNVLLPIHPSSLLGIDLCSRCYALLVLGGEENMTA